MEGWSIRKFFLLWGTNLLHRGWSFPASKPPSERDTECKSFNLTISFLAFTTFTGPVKWFRFHNLNPWPSLNLPNIFCQEASWTFEGKVNQTGVCFPSVEAKCLLRPAGLILSVGRGWLPITSRGGRDGLVEMVTDAGEGRSVNRTRNLGALPRAS